MARTGRPRKEIDQIHFEKLCSIMCTKDEIAGFFDCSPDTIENYCKKTYRKTFSAVYKDKSAQGKISLRRTQFKLAEKSPAMAIFLGKQYLGQTDKVETTYSAIDPEIKKSIEEMIDEAAKRRAEEDN